VVKIKKLKKSFRLENNEVTTLSF